MFSTIWHTFFYNPVYNSLVFFLDYIPNGDLGISIILVTIIVKLVLFPLSKKAVKTQMVMKRIEPQLQEIKEKYKDDRQKLGQKMMELYKDNDVHPLSSIGIIAIQLPLIFSLYWIFYRSGLPEINAELLYSFIPIPTVVSMNFIGLIDMAGKSLLLAVGAGATQFYQIHLTLPSLPEKKADATMKEDLARSFQMQMKYVMPVFVFFAAYFISAAVALYWLTSNLFSIGQEFVIRKQVREKFNEV